MSYINITNADDLFNILNVLDKNQRSKLSVDMLIGYNHDVCSILYIDADFSHLALTECIANETISVDQFIKQHS